MFFRYILNYIRIFFISIFLSGDKIKADNKYQEKPSISTISKDQDQKEIEFLLSDECSIAYNPNSPEAIKERGFIFGTFDDVFNNPDFKVIRGYVEEDTEPATLLSEEDAYKLLERKNRILNAMNK